MSVEAATYGHRDDDRNESWYLTIEAVKLGGGGRFVLVHNTSFKRTWTGTWHQAGAGLDLDAETRADFLGEPGPSTDTFSVRDLHDGAVEVVWRPAPPLATALGEGRPPFEKTPVLRRMEWKKGLQ